MRQLIALVVLLTAACTTIDPHSRVEGWPELQVIEYRVSHDEMRRRCDRYVAFGMIPLACAEFHLDARTCHIWLDRDYAPAHIVEHERMHCLGYQHHGDDGMAVMFGKWRASR